jgi:hypothetical protein
MNTQLPKFETQTQVDFVVIGAGAAGGIIAKELSTSGFNVVVLEQGPYLKEKDFDHDEIKTLWHNALTNDWKKQPISFRKSPNAKATVQPALLTAKWWVADGALHRELLAISRNRFRRAKQARDNLGNGFRRLADYYAELDCITQKPNGNWCPGEPGPFDHRGQSPTPSAAAIKSAGALLATGARKLGWHLSRADGNHLSTLSRTQRVFALRLREGFGREIRAKSSTLAP